jgi:hypothetical protein
MRRLKVLGLALVAVVAISAVASASASAFTEFVSSPASQTITASQGEGAAGEHVFTVGTGTVKCKKATFKDIAKKGSSASAPFRPEYSECTAFGFVSATVTTHNQCEYELFANESVSIVNWNNVKEQEPGAGENTCAAPKTIAEAEAKKAQEIEIDAGATCKVFVGAQGPRKEVKYENVEGANKHKSVKATIKVEKTVAFSNGSGFGCPAKGENKEATYTGTSVAEGSEGTVEVK